MECICESCARKDCQERTKQGDLRIVITCADFMKPNFTNADRIRAMDDETLASQLTQVFCEGVEALSGIRLPNEILNEARSEFLKKLKEPAEGE